MRTNIALALFLAIAGFLTVVLTTPTLISAGADEDGFTVAGGDCNDDDPDVHPGAVDIPGDGIDQNCDGADAVDEDMDGFPTPQDCNDLDGTVNPGAVDIPGDGIDQDCDGADAVDEDMDGFPTPQDCDDLDATVNPGAVDIPGDGIDQDCDGADAQSPLPIPSVGTWSLAIMAAAFAVVLGWRSNRRAVSV